MSEICLQFGQCGNQLGSNFFQNIHETDSKRTRWFRTSLKGKDIAKCILVDSENKVVTMILNNHQTSKWQYTKRNCVSSRGGCGNNWALGYFQKGPLIFDKVLEVIRVEIEKCDSVKSFFGFMGAGGGTGSGLGTFILENLRDIFPQKNIMSTLVIPSYTRENPVEFYNTILSMSKLHKCCDAIMTFYNDILFKQCSSLYNNKEFKYDDMNFIISNQLATLFKSFNDSNFIDNHIHRMISLPFYKFLTFMSYPYILPNKVYDTSVKWDTLFKQLSSVFIKRSTEFSNSHIYPSHRIREFHKSLGNMVICNGYGCDTAKNHAEKYFQKDELYVPWVSKSERFIYVSDTKPSIKYPYATLVSNSGIFNSRLNKIVEHAWRSLHMDAYFHHFEQCGLDKGTFLFEFLNIEKIINAYNIP